MKRCFTVYNAQIDQFVRLKKCSEPSLEKVLHKIERLVQAEDFNIKRYIEFVCLQTVLNYREIIKAEPECVESLFENVVEVYPVFQVEHVVRFINSRQLEEEELEHQKANTLSEVMKLEKNLKSHIIGQDEAISNVIKCVKLINSGLESFMCLFFIGPTGVGKTELCRQLAKDYLGSADRLLKINCAEYASAHEYAKLIGSPPGYIGHNEKGILTQKSEESPQWIIVFDEIEKAHTRLYDLLLNLMEEGSVMDSRGTQLDFSQSLILFTSNVGMQDTVGKKVMGFEAHDVTYDEAKERIKESFETNFSPEFRNRIDEIIYFNQLDQEDARKIARLRLKELPLSVTKRLVDHVVSEAFSDKYGARNLKRYIKNNISTKIADHILSGERDCRFRPIFSKNNLVDVSSIN